MYTERDLRSRSGVCFFLIPHPRILFSHGHLKMFLKDLYTDENFHHLEFCSMGKYILNSGSQISLSLWISLRVLENVFFDPNGCLHDLKAFHLQFMSYQHNLFWTFMHELWWYKIRLWWLQNQCFLTKTYSSFSWKNTLLKTICLQGTFEVVF